jgi:CO dehydrogenase/acetyl-CoA synthase beta subunit
MGLFDPYFALIRDYEDDLRIKGRIVRVWPADQPRVGEQAETPAQTTLILKEDTAVELGGPASAGTAFLLWTDDVSLVSDGRVTLIGPDITETTTNVLPLGQVMLVAGSSLKKELQPRLERDLRYAEGVPGYATRSTGGRIWSRVSRRAYEDGFSLRRLGGTILSQLHRKQAAEAAAEIVFVTSSVEDVQSLEKIGAQVRKLSHDLRRERLKQVSNGEYECQSGVACDVCTDNEVCADIRQIVAIRKSSTTLRKPPS